MPRLSHVNQSVVMINIKVIVQFMNCIDDIKKIKIFCKKLTKSIMSLLISYPEIQSILLKYLHAIVLKRPILLEKEFSASKICTWAHSFALDNGSIIFFKFFDFIFI